MNRFLFFLAFFLFLESNISGQEFNKAFNKDSLLREIVKDLPEAKKEDFLKTYNEGNEQTKDLLLFMLYTRSSKKKMIINIDSNFDKINYLKTEYSKIVPKNYIVSIEFNPINRLIMTKESIDLKIEHKDGNGTVVEQDWNLSYDSKKLAEMIKPLNWTSEILTSIKIMLTNANCVSIENGEITTIGFARSGMGKYFFKLFDNDLTDEQIKRFNDGCTYIFYKKNIVLEYGGGAVGSQCFTD